jgi:saccharopepsin
MFFISFPQDQTQEQESALPGGFDDLPAEESVLPGGFDDLPAEESALPGGFDDLPADVLNMPAADKAPNASELFSVKLTRQKVPINSDEGLEYHKSAYFGELTVGDPPVTFTVVFDTGSGHLILPSTYCHSDTCRVHTRYRRSQSRTAKDIDYDGTLVEPGQPRDQITISFGTGEATGVFVEDVVCLGEDKELKQALDSEVEDEEEDSDSDSNGLSDGCVKLRMIAATDMSEDPFKSFNFDGVLGLGLDGLSQASEFNFLNVMAASEHRQSGTAPQTFSVFLGDSEAEDSEISFGGWKQEHLAGNLGWNKVVMPEEGHWMIQIDSLTVAGERLKFCDDGQCRAVVDTGTSLLAVPTAIFPELYELLKHSAHRSGECGVAGIGYDLNIQLENFTVSLGPKDYARPEERESGFDQPWQEVLNKPAFDPSVRIRHDVMCKPMLMSMDLPAPLGPKLFILGEPVLRKYYTVYDGREKRVGFGRAIHGSNFEDVDDSHEDDPDPSLKSGSKIPIWRDSLIQTDAKMNPKTAYCPSMIQNSMSTTKSGLGF